jgi:hypothetical protein
MRDPNVHINPEISSLASSTVLLLLQALREGRIIFNSTLADRPQATASVQQIKDKELDIDVPSMKAIINGLTHWLRLTRESYYVCNVNISVTIKHTSTLN